MVVAGVKIRVALPDQACLPKHTAKCRVVLVGTAVVARLQVLSGVNLALGVSAMLATVLEAIRGEIALI